MAEPLVRSLLDATGLSVMVLGPERQVLVATTSLLRSMGSSACRRLAQLRPGDLLACTQAAQRSCGTSAECAACGTFLAVRECQETGIMAEHECLLNIDRGDGLEARELHVRAVPVRIGGERCTLVAVRDISSEKRRDALEHVFLHDISNTLGALTLRTQLLLAQAPEPSADPMRAVGTLVSQLRREVDDHRLLLAAERGTLPVRPNPLAPATALLEASAVVKEHPVARGRTLEVTMPSEVPTIATDPSLLSRVLINMMKNAMEATSTGGVVRAWVEPHGEGCVFAVWNEGAIDSKVALQVFKRSFSTKTGLGRGLGTFSMKLLTERYLGGSVSFTSTPAAGTTFCVQLPMAPRVPVVSEAASS